MKFNKNWIVVISVLILLPISLFVIYTNAEISPTDRFFSKSLCQADSSITSGILYNTGREISYDTTGCPESTIVIHDWNNISTLNQNLITTRMTTSGYTDITSSITPQLK